MKNVFENYECDGQVTIAQFLRIKAKEKELQEKYPIPRTYQKDEGWQDDWHYTEMELPKVSKVYYCIHKCFKSEHYMYTYMAWAYGHWWAWESYTKKWLFVNDGRRAWMKPFAWVEIPDLYLRTDECLPIRLETFITKEDFEYAMRWESRKQEAQDEKV